MNLKVKQAYSGRLTSGRIVYPGVYAADDPAVELAAETMIAKGFAEWTLEALPQRDVVFPIPADVPAIEDAPDEDDVIGAEVREETLVRVDSADDEPQPDPEPKPRTPSRRR